MISRQTIFILLLILAGVLLAGEVFRHWSGGLGESKPIARVVAPAPVSESPKVEAPAAPEVAIAPSVSTTEPVATVVEPSALAPVAAAPRRAKQAPVLPADAAPAIPPEVARQALGLVGADADAEVVWAQAINDPNMPPNTRKDLIEDLNEDGFADPKHLTPDDLPLIESRLALIEEIGGDAMDDVNAAAFAEAYKDLVNMYDKVAGQ